MHVTVRPTDPRDKVFAILGMVDNSGDSISIDYSLPVSEVARLTFKKLVSCTNDSLEALIYSQNPDRERGIPSWAPDICAPFGAKPLRLNEVYSASGDIISLYSAAQGLEGYWDTPDDSHLFLQDGVTLRVCASSVDTIKAQTNSNDDLRGFMFADLEYTVREWRSSVLTWLGAVEVHVKYEHFMRTLTGDRDIQGRRMSTIRRTSLHNEPDWRTVFRIEHIGVGHRAEFEFLSRAIHKNSTDFAVIASEIHAWLRLCEDTIRGRRMILSSAGRIGLVPTASRVGDVICLIIGLDVPFVVRTLTDSTYVLVGEAYIHGAMDGEIGPEQQSDSSPVIGCMDLQ